MVLNHNYFSIYTIGEKSKNTIIPTMADVVEKISQENTLGMFRLVTIAAHITSLSLALVVRGNNSGSYPKHDLLTGKDTTVSDLQAPAMQMVSDIVVLAVSLLLFLRDLDVDVVKRYIDYEGQNLGGYQGGITSFVHIVLYAFTSVISTLMIYMFFGGQDFVLAVVLAIAAILSEAALHIVTRNSKEVKEGQLLEGQSEPISRFVMIIGGLGFLASAIILFVNITVYATSSSDKTDTGSLFAAYIVALGLKVVHELLSNVSTWWKGMFDRRHGHLIIDLALKGGVAWSVITREMYMAKDPIDDKTLADAMPIATMILGALAVIVAALPFVKKDARSNLQAPSGSMEEKERMLQVA